MRLNNSFIKKIIFFFIVLTFVFAAKYRLLKAQRVEIKTKDNITIVGSFYPVSDKNSPAVIMLHMLGRNRGDWNKYARYLQKEGIAVVSLDLRGHGESTNFFKIDWHFFKRDDYSRLISDIDPIVDFLVKKKGVDQNKIGILGLTIGGNIALNYAAKNKNIATVVLVSPGLDYKGIQTEQAVVLYGNRPLYMICSDKEPYSLHSSRKLQSLAQGKVKLDIYKYKNVRQLLISANNIVNKAITHWFVTNFLDSNKRPDQEFDIE